MDEELRIMMENHKLDMLYKHNLFSVKSISQLIGSWDNYSPEEKERLENLTKRDSKINKNFTYEGEYDKRYVYGEIKRSGVDTLIEKISKYKNITDKDVFIDIGSGTGKLLIHMGIKSKFKTLVGLELQKDRLEYSKIIKEQVLPEKPIFFLNKDVRDFDLSIGTVFFMNDLYFDEELRNDIYNRIPKGSHIIAGLPIPDCKLLKELLPLEVTWSQGFIYKYYIK
jgi:hypothetical protein